MLLPEGLTPSLLALVVVAALTAGWVDAVVGGGGLIQLPALLLVPGLSPVQALGTNKLASVFGTATSAVTYQRRIHPDLRTALPMAAVAGLAGAAGASVAALLPERVFTPVIVVALVGIALFTAFRPALGGATALRHTGRRHLGTALAVGVVIGCYDGVLGPGTGSFLVFALVSLLGYGFLDASATAKIVNVATNLGALAVFVPHGAVVWGLGLLLAAANTLGGYLGSRTAVRRGTGFVRAVFLVVVTALIARLGWDVWTDDLRPLLG